MPNLLSLLLLLFLISPSCKQKPSNFKLHLTAISTRYPITLYVFKFTGRPQPELLDTITYENNDPRTLNIQINQPSIIILYHATPLPVLAIPGTEVTIEWNIFKPLPDRLDGPAQATRFSEAYRKLVFLNYKFTGKTDPFRQFLFLQSVLSSDSSMLKAYIDSVSLIVEECNDPACYYMYSSLLSFEYLDYLDEVISKIQQDTSHPIASLIYRRYLALKRVAPGNKAPDFKMPDLNDKPFSLSMLKDSMILLDFWASWCLPCRQSSPILRKIYRKYSQFGFTIVSISADTSRENWLRAIKEDSLFLWQWHLNDLQGFNSPVFELYQVFSIPTYILIGQDGKIIARDIHNVYLLDSLIRTHLSM